MQESNEQVWKEMLAKSFHPSQWFIREGWDEARDGPGKEIAMWVYRRTDNNCYTVGYYDPRGEWIAESDHVDKEEAAARVAYLNGGRRS